MRCSVSFSNFTSAIRLVSRARFNARFVFYALLHLYQSGGTEDLQRRTTGIRNLDFAAYKVRASFPLIPLSEQRKIAAVLNLVQRAIEQQERLIALTSELKRTLLHHLFTRGLRGEPQKQTEIGPVPVSWEVVPLGSVAKFQTGGTPRRDVQEYWEGGTIPWVKTTEIDYCGIKATEEHITAAGLDDSSAKVFPPGTLLVAMYGQGVTRGRVAVLEISAATNQACAAITSHDQRKLSAPFIYYFLQHHYEDLRQMGHGANQRNLNMALLKSFCVAYPTPIEQATIVDSLSSIDRKQDLHRRKLEGLTGLFRTLLHELMTAKIRVNDLDLSELGLEPMEADAMEVA